MEHTKTNSDFRAQHGEDCWLNQFFAGKKSGFYIEVGAYNGVDLSNSFYFEQIGWNGILVEPDPKNAASCQERRPRAKVYQCAAIGDPDTTQITFHQIDGAAGVFSSTQLAPDHLERVTNMGRVSHAISVPARTLNSILEAESSTHIDFVSIDVEGAETSVLAGFDIAKWKPVIVLIESNRKYRDPIIRDYFVRNRYIYYKSIDVNDFYIRTNHIEVIALIRDRVNYFCHIISRRIERTVYLFRRAYRKHFLK